MVHFNSDVYLNNSSWVRTTWVLNICIEEQNVYYV